MSYDVQIIADSIGPNGARITTFQLRYPRMIHAEVMTHRAFCLAGDAVLEFDLPAGAKGKYRRVHRMRLDDFVDKWVNGANRAGCKPKEERDLGWIAPECEYTAQEVASALGMATAANINTLCRSGAIQARKGDRGEWRIRGQEVIAWRQSSPDHSRFDIKARLAGMRIRQLNEDTGDIQCSTVLSAIDSGIKDVFEVQAGDYRVAGSAEHRVLTADGWKPIKSIRPGDMIIVRRYGKHADERLDPLRLKKIGGVWRSRWQAAIREEMTRADEMCRRCRRWYGTEIHHVVPVYVDSSRAMDETNVTLLCGPCHQEMHEKQGWQVGNHLYGAACRVDQIVYRGAEPTYDLEIAGAYPNFIANGVVVHNSRNASSTRAIPTAKMIEWIEKDPAMPVYWGKNQRGMQATQELSRQEALSADACWLSARDQAIRDAKQMMNLGVHKQIASRILEPWAHINVIVTATSFDNFFALRCDKNAMPEIQVLAVKMARAYRDSESTRVAAGDWHLPYVTDDEWQNYRWRQDNLPNSYERESLGRLLKYSVARCARVSYLTFEGKEPDPARDIELHDTLLGNGHWSPFEHQAMASSMTEPLRSGNLFGWKQYRQLLPRGVHERFDFAKLDEFDDRDFIV